jgi:DNA-binding NarL/FixJ family response regulator
MPGILLVDDHPIVRQGCRTILEDAADLAAMFSLRRTDCNDVGEHGDQALIEAEILADTAVLYQDTTVSRRAGPNQSLRMSRIYRSRVTRIPRLVS